MGANRYARHMRFLFFAPFIVACAAAPVATKAPAGPVWEVEGVNGLGLFAFERTLSREAVSEALRTLGKTPADAAMVDRAWSYAAGGRNPFTGANCGRALSPFQARQRWGRALGLAGNTSASVWCPDEKPCELSIYTHLIEEEGERFEFDANIDREGAPLVALKKALTTLAPPPPADGSGGAGLLGGLMGAQAIQTDDLLRIEVETADSRETHQSVADAFSSVTAAQVTTCFGPNRNSASLLLEVASTGAITRCEPDFYETGSAETTCACVLLAGAAHAPAMNGRRWSVDLRVDRRDQLTSDGRLVLTASWNTRTRSEKKPGETYARWLEHVQDPSIEGWFPGPERLVAGCFAGRTEAGQINSRWAVWFDAQGNAMKAAEQKGWAPLDAETAQCVINALRTAQAPCPSRANLWAIVNLHVNLRDPNAPQKSPLEDVLEKKP